MGWIKLDRSILNSSLWDQDEPFDCRSAYIDLLLNACFVDSDIPTKNGVVRVKKGQYLTTIVFLSKRWKWSRNKVYRFLKSLDGTLLGTRDGTPDGTQNRTLITLMEYGFSAGDETRDGTPLGTPLGTRDGTLYKNNKNKEENKKELNSNSNSEFGEYKNISLTGEEYGMLIGEFGLEATKQKIAECSQWKNQKNVPYRKSDYALLRRWLENNRDKFTEPPKRPLPEPIKEEPAEEEDTVANMSDDEWVRWMNENYKG